METEKIVAVIPAYNCENSIGSVVRRARKHTDAVIVVDDGSKDRTFRAAKRAGARAIRLEKNSGKAEALREAVLAARKLHPKYVVFLDADGQHDPEEIPELVRELRRARADICIGTRLSRGRSGGMPRRRYFSNKLSSKLTALFTGFRITDVASGYRAFNSKALRLLSFRGHRYDIELATILEAEAKDLKICEIPIRTIYGRETSHINPAKLIIGTSYLWLRWLLRRKSVR
jgi:glycosyltransferase involved in cell wall biosynthesis